MGVTSEGYDSGISLADGFCQFMGDGVVMVHQIGDGGEAHTVVLTVRDLSNILATEAA